MRSSRDQHQLLLEGSEEKSVIKSLLRCHGFIVPDGATQAQRGMPTFRDYDGITDLMRHVEENIKSYRRLGFVFDADARLDESWEEFRAQASRASVAVPERPCTAGTIVPGFRGEGAIGVWVMPNNRDLGMLEDFLASMIPDGDPCWPHAQRSTSAALKLPGARLKPVHESKGATRAWLAWQETPGKPFSTALERGWLRHDGELASAFMAWFIRLFDLSPVREPS